VPAVARVAVNVRGITTEQVARGDALVTPVVWRRTASVDVRLGASDGSPGQGMLHVDTTAVEARIRPLSVRRPASPCASRSQCRLATGPSWATAGAQRILSGVLIVDVNRPSRNAAEPRPAVARSWRPTPVSLNSQSG